jgi:hypothetical protein
MTEDDNIIQMRDYETVEERQIKADRLHMAIMHEIIGGPDYPTFQAPPDDPA